MVQVTFNQSVIHDGHNYLAGDTLEVSEAEGRRLEDSGLAKAEKPVKASASIKGKQAKK